MSISTIFHRLATLDGWKAMLACYASGALMAFAFAPFNMWPVIFLSLPLFYVLLDSAMNTRRAVLRGLAFGYGYFMFGTWWIANSMLVDIAKFGWMIPFSVLGLSGALAIYFGLFGAAMHWWRVASLRLNLLRFVLLWVLVEYLRSIGIFGFPWNLAGYIALSSLKVAQLGSVVGTFGLGFLVVLVGVLPVLAWKGEGRVSRVKGFVLPVVMIALAYGYGVVRLPQGVAMTETHLRIVQPNIPQSIKSSSEGRFEAMQVLGDLSGKRTEVMPDITVWSETAYPFSIRDARADMYPPSGLLVTGALRVEGTNETVKIFNSIAAIDAHGVVRDTFDKGQLVPFGEFVPLRSVLPLDKITPGSLDFSRGKGPTTIAVDAAPSFSPLVCYEVVFPWLAVDEDHRPAWMVNATNDGWYGKSPGPYQHFAMGRMRAIEQGLPLVRAANSGISAIVDPYGRITGMLPLDVRGVVDGTLPAALKPTIYARTGELLTVLTIVFFWILTCIPYFWRKLGANY